MKTINYHLICPFQRRRCCAFLISSAKILNTKYEHIHIQRKRNTDGVAHSHTFVGRVTRFARQPCPIKNGTPVGFNLFLNHIRYEITKTISGKLLFQKGEGHKENVFHEENEPHRGSAFDSPGLASVASYPGLMCCVGHNAIGVALL